MAAHSIPCCGGSFRDAEGRTRDSRELACQTFENKQPSKVQILTNEKRAPSPRHGANAITCDVRLCVARPLDAR